MLHHERLKPPSQDYPPNEWSVIERSFRPEFISQMETILALGNGYPVQQNQNGSLFVV